MIKASVITLNPTGANSFQHLAQGKTFPDRQQIANQTHTTTDKFNMADSFPVQICHFKRAALSKVFKSIADYGFCASKEENFYGFKGHLMISFEGVVTGITLTAANVDERASLWELLRSEQKMDFR